MHTVQRPQIIPRSTTNPSICNNNITALVRGVLDCGFKNSDLIIPRSDIAPHKLSIAIYCQLELLLVGVQEISNGRAQFFSNLISPRFIQIGDCDICSKILKIVSDATVLFLERVEYPSATKARTVSSPMPFAPIGY